MSELKPMLAVAAPENIAFPVYASPKLDGIRCLIRNGAALSRTLKMIPNEHIQHCIGSASFDGLDGELIVGDATHPNVMQKTSSGVMSFDGTPSFTFWVFDYWFQRDVPYNERFGHLQHAFDSVLKDIPYIKLLPQKLIYTSDDLTRFESECVAKGYEGVITRSFASPYKYGRSTAKEQFLLKIKRFEDSEAEIIGFEEFMHNENVAELDERGYTKRSSHQENKINGNKLGAFIVRDITSQIEFNIGTGFTMEQREQFWRWREGLIGKIVKYKYMATGVKVAPRHPVFLDFRYKTDMGEL